MRLVVSLFFAAAALAAAQPAEIVPANWLVLPAPVGGGRVAFLPGPAWARYMWPEQPAAPREGEAVPIWPGRSETWRAQQAAGGVLEGPLVRSAYAATIVELPEACVMVLEATGTLGARLGSAWFAGDPYRTGTLRQPVALQAGPNLLIVAVAGGRLGLRLVAPRGCAELVTADATLPSLREGVPLDLPGAVPVVNTTPHTLVGCELEVGDGVHVERARVPVPPIAPFAALQVAFPLRSVAGVALPEGKTVAVPIAVVPREGAGDRGALALPLARELEAYRVTFSSQIDGSVQYYALRPPALPAEPQPALVLSLHGAGVEAIGQARAYSAKRWAWIACPTNRRPFGFDWEDWGREDALEVLEHAAARCGTDPTRVYLTGHSMGGHGAWHLAATAPDRWAAVGPSAGWISFDHYGGRGPEDRSPMGLLLRRLTGASDTLALLRNLEPLAVYIVHGERDDNVPVTHARAMRQSLGAFHSDVQAHEQPGAGHWWDGPDHPGADCVDWPPMWRMFQRRRRDLAPTAIRFTTANLGASDRCHWLRLREQAVPYGPSTITAEADPRGTLRIGTENLVRFRLDPAPVVSPGALAVHIDGETTRVDWAGGELEARREAGRWQVGPPEPEGARKRPERGGPFRQAFGRRFVLVYGTGGTAADQAAALARARLDAFRWGYQANGRALLVADRDFDPTHHAGSNLIWYGNEATHAQWAQWGPRWPLRVGAGAIALGDERVEGASLACLAVMPHPDDPAALIGLVGGSDAAGLRLSASVPYFQSGVALPDVAIWDAEVLAQGSAAVRLGGLLGPDWTLTGAELVRGAR